MTPPPPALLALTRDISPAIEHCELTHLERTTIDLARARAQHEAYERALRELGCEVRRRPSLRRCARTARLRPSSLLERSMAVTCCSPVVACSSASAIGAMRRARTNCARS